MKDFKSQIREAAGRHEEYVDAHSIWSGIQKKMDQPEKKRRLFPFFIWGGSATFMFLLFLGFYVANRGGLDVDNINSIASNVLSNENSSRSSFVKNEKLKSKTTTDLNHPSLNHNVKNETQISRESIRIPKETIGKSFTDRPNTYPEHIQTLNYEVRTPSTLTKEGKNSQILLLDRDTPDPIFSTNLISKNRKTYTIQSLQNTIDLEHNRPLIDVPSLYYSPVPSLSKSDKKFSLINSVTLYSQYGFGSKTSSGNLEYAYVKNQSEELLEQIRIGLEVDLVRLMDFTVYTGVSYVSINDRVHFEDSFFMDREITYLKEIFISPDGTEEEIYETENLPHQINTKSTRYNNHRLISIPIGLKIGRTISNYTVGLGFGFDLNYYLSDNHNVLNTINQLTTISVGGKWTSPSFHTSINVDYRLTEHLFLHSKLMYRNIKLENELSEAYSIYGIDLGLTYQF